MTFFFFFFCKFANIYTGDTGECSLLMPDTGDIKMMYVACYNTYYTILGPRNVTGDTGKDTQVNRCMLHVATPIITSPIYTNTIRKKHQSYRTSV